MLFRRDVGEDSIVGRRLQVREVRTWLLKRCVPEFACHNGSPARGLRAFAVDVAAEQVAHAALVSHECFHAPLNISRHTIGWQPLSGERDLLRNFAHLELLADPLGSDTRPNRTTLAALVAPPLKQHGKTKEHMSLVRSTTNLVRL